jgi:hypothetical protein
LAGGERWKKPRAENIYVGVAGASQTWNGMIIAWAIVVWALDGALHIDLLQDMA